MKNRAAILGLYLILGAVIPGVAWAKHPQGFSGSVGLGASSSTGTSTAISLNTENALYWLEGPWSNISHFSYNYARSNGAATADRLAIRNATRYLFTANTFASANLGYIRNHFDGYYYRFDQAVGIGHYFHLAPQMLLTTEAGVGARESHRIGSVSRLSPIARLSAAYDWQFATHAKFSEEIEAILAADGANTYESRLRLDSPLVGALAMRFSFIATYNSQVLVGFKPFNTLTAVNLVYHF